MQIPGFIASARRGTAALLKDFGVTWDGDFGWHTLSGGRFTTRYPGSDVDWEGRAGKLWYNPAVGLCIQYIFDKLIEPRIHVVYSDAEGLLQPVEGHPLTELMLKPNGEYHGNALLGALAMSYKIAGNAYAVKVRSAIGGPPLELYYVPHWQIAPMPPPDGKGPTEFYAYKQPKSSGGYEATLIPAMNVIHIKNGLDPENPRVGLRQMASQLRGVCSDNEIDTTTAIVLGNKGIFGSILSPADSTVEIDPDQFDELKEKLMQASSGDFRGSLVGVNLPIKIEKVSQTMDELQIATIGERPQSRICSAFGIDPMAIGLPVATGKGAQYGALKKEARESSYEQCMLPLLAAIAEGLTYSLLPDFPRAKVARTFAPKTLRRMKWASKAHLRHYDSLKAASDTVSFRVNFDYSDVRDLSEDQDATHKRATGDFSGNIVTLDEAREEIGLKACADAEMGGKFSFQLLGGPAGEFGVVPGPNDENHEPTPTPASVNGKEDLPEEADEDGDDDS